MEWNANDLDVYKNLEVIGKANGMVKFIWKLIYVAGFDYWNELVEDVCPLLPMKWWQDARKQAAVTMNEKKLCRWVTFDYDTEQGGLILKTRYFGHECCIRRGFDW